MGIVYIDNREVEVGDDERLNGVQAAQRAGVEIPHYCWHAGLSVVASCRMCLVESGTKNPETGQVSMVPKLVPACQTPAKAGTVFVTDSDKVRAARAMVEEDLLLDHPIDCPICDKAGECLLQDYHFRYGQKERRADLQPFTSRRRDVGPTVTLFVDRCIMCTRCVRFTREISGTSELMVTHRGSHEEIDTVPGFPLNNKLAGNVVDLCPVGALGDKDFLYQQRVWFMRRRPQVCAHCSTGCSVFVEENQDHVYRIKPRENQAVNQWWMCDEGRYGFHHVHSPERLVEARRQDDQGSTAIEWDTAFAELPPKLSQAGKLAAVVSPHLTVEEAYLLGKLLRQLDPQAVLALGPVPVQGQDETFKNGFTIHAEKCPNRRGVEAVLKHFMGKVLTFDALLPRVEQGEFGALWVTGGYREPWIDEATAARTAGAKLLVMQDLFPSPLWNRANYQLPGVAYPERAGSYVNAGGLLQSFSWAVRPPAGNWIEGHVYWRLLGQQGLYNPRMVLVEMAAEIPYFAAAAEPVPETGVQLEAAELAAAK